MTTRMHTGTVRELVVRELAARDVPEEDAAAVADALVESTARGIDTHGVRLLPRYLDELDQGIARPRPQMRAVRDAGAAALLDADSALGPVAGLAAVREALPRARRYGVGVVVVRNSNHFGAASVYSRAMARQGTVGWALTSAASRVAPYGGRTPLFGTNPISVAAEGADDEFVLDMASSEVSMGRIQEYGRNGTPLEPGWAKDARGLAARTAADAAALTPVGDGYKGQGLGMLVSLLTAALAGAPLDWELDHFGGSPSGRGREVAHFLLCLDPVAFAGPDRFRARLGDLLHATRDAPAVSGTTVRCPGDPERDHARDVERHGLPVDPRTADRLRELARRYGIERALMAPGRG
ncbi:Ldh family oxidoreductase [Streptomyces sp. NPDC059002]|uniref:Ldh family oxidoreductase n=1 Tax=Streptomyces sp. NPDC059002 TaxID=3346690 RepID=UPI0036A1FB1A